MEGKLQIPIKYNPRSFSSVTMEIKFTSFSEGENHSLFDEE